MSYDNYQNAEKFLRNFIQERGIVLACDEAIREISDDLAKRNDYSYYYEDKSPTFIMKSVKKYQDYLFIYLSLDDPKEKRYSCDSCGDYGESVMEITGHNGLWGMSHRFGCYGGDSLSHATKQEMVEKLESLKVFNQPSYKYQNKVLKNTIKEILDSPAT